MTDASHAGAGKAPLAPDLRETDERTVRAWTEAMAVRPLRGGRYAVDSESGATYVVDLPEATCTCPDHQLRGRRCKHVRRVAIEVNRRLVPPPGERVGTCVACGREAFVPEARDLPLCDDCRLAPGDVVTDRETGDPLVVERVTDRRADAVGIEAAGCTVADYPTNEGYPAGDPVVEVVYPGSLRRGDPRVYSFPLSRLEPHRPAATRPEAADGTAVSAPGGPAD